MSSATVLFVLERFLHGSSQRSEPGPGGWKAAPGCALVTALGPGFSAESLILRADR